MKKITQFFLLLSITLGYSQQQTYQVTFETGSTVGTWTTFENNDGDHALEILANPVSGGINTSATVAKFTAKSTANGGQPWAGTQSDHTSLGTWLLETGNNTISIMVYKPVISDVGIKFVNSTDGTIFELKKPNISINTWETITYDISSFISSGENHDIDRLVVFPDWPATRTQDNVCYFDNVSWTAKKTANPGSGSSNSNEPLVAATTPTELQANVISLFSNAYTNVNVDTWRTNWSAATLTDVVIAGNDTKKYSSLNFVGIETTGANFINASAMSYFHVDFWTAEMTVFRVKLVDFGANAAFSGGDDVEHELSFTPTLNEWNSLNIKLSDMTGLTTKNHIAQLIFSGAPAGSGIVYIDNVYFSTQSTLAINNFELRGLSVYPNPANEFWTITSKNETIKSVEIFDFLGRVVLSLKPNKLAVNIDASNLAAGIYISKIKTELGESSKKLIKY